MGLGWLLLIATENLRTLSEPYADSVTVAPVVCAPEHTTGHVRIAERERQLGLESRSERGMSRFSALAASPCNPGSVGQNGSSLVNWFRQVCGSPGSTASTSPA